MTLTIGLLIISLLWLFMGSIINILERFWLTEPMIALLAGIIAGPLFLLVRVPELQQESILEWGARLTIAMALMATALRFRHSYIVSNKKMLGVLVIGGMLLMFFSSVLIARFLLNLEWPLAVLIGAIITPTDPVISSSMMSGKYAVELLNNNIKSSLFFESGINDGLALPLVAIGWMLAGRGEMDWLEWFGRIVVYENLLAAGAGGLLGYGAGVVMHNARRRHLMVRKTLLTFSMGLGIFVLTFLELLGMNGIIGVFVAGLLFNRAVEEAEDLEEEKIQEAIERLFTIPIFFLIGVMLPWREWLDLGLPLALFIVAVLLFRRLPALIILRPFLDKISRWPRVLLTGWFGPIGIAALLYALMSVKETGHYDILPVVMAVVAASVLVHGLTSFPFSILYNRHDRNDLAGDSDSESISEKEET
jgi:sodium/hydrogen antiporter